MTTYYKLLSFLISFIDLGNGSKYDKNDSWNPQHFALVAVFDAFI